MRIIAGSARGVTLKPPPDHSVRPTLDRVREACFSILGPAIPGARFLDLFAGTGANGLEALSRGAAHADLVESNRESRAIIEENIRRTRLSDRAKVHALSVPEGLNRLAGTPPYDVVYADPPHAFTDFQSLLVAIERASLVTVDGLVVLEHATRAEVPGSVGTLEKVRDASYGKTTLSFYKPLNHGQDGPG